MEFKDTGTYFEVRMENPNIVIGFELREEDKTAVFHNIFFEQEHIKSFIVCLNSIIHKLQQKTIFTKVIQHVTKLDWDNFLKKDTDLRLLAEVTQENVNICVIDCDIDKSLGCIARGLGVYEHGTNYETVLE